MNFCLIRGCDIQLCVICVQKHQVTKIKHYLYPNILLNLIFWNWQVYTKLMSFMMHLLNIIWGQKFFPQENNLLLVWSVILVTTMLLGWWWWYLDMNTIMPLTALTKPGLSPIKRNFLTSPLSDNGGFFDHFDPHFKRQFSNFNSCNSLKLLQLYW